MNSALPPKGLVKRLLFLIIPICLSNSAFSQWIDKTLPEGRLPIAIEVPGINTFYAGDADGIYKSINGGASWTTITKQFTNFNPDLAFLFDSNIDRLYFLDENTGFSYGMTSSSLFNVIYKTTDGGITWTLVHYSPGLGYVKMHFANAMQGFAVGLFGTIVKTTDGGSTWSVLTSPTEDNLRSVFFTDSNNGVIVGDEVILRTSNGGSSWSMETGFSSVFTSVFFSSTTTGYISGYNTVLKTTDGGITWARLNSNLPYSDTQFYKIIFTDALTGFVASSKGLYKTIDGGKFWAVQKATKNLTVQDFDFSPGAQTGVILLSGNPNIKKLKTTASLGDPMPQHDVKLIAVNEYPNSLCRGVYEVKAQIVNQAIPTLTTAEIHWSVNNVEQTPYQWTGNLSVLDTSSLFTVGSYNFNKSLQDFSVKVWTINPNGSADENPEDDLLSKIYRFNILSGTYTLGGSSPDFNNFQAVADALNQYGICQSVIFNIRNGTYSTSNRMNLVQIPGTSSTNTIVFQAETGNARDVIYSGAASGEVYLNGTSYVTFRNITFNTVNVQVSKSNQIVFERNIFTGNSTSRLLYLNPSATGSVKIQNNLFQDGSKGLEYYNFSGTKAAGLIEIDRNTFENQQRFGIEVTGLNEKLVITNNRIVSAQATPLYNGIMVERPVNDVYVFNNYVQVIGAGSTSYATGITVYGSAAAKLYYNTVTLSDCDGSVLNLGEQQTDIKNNILTSYGKASVFGMIPKPENVSSDYNNIYAPNAIIGRLTYSGFDAMKFETWQPLSGFDLHSISIDPQLLPGNPLISLGTTNQALNGKATPLAEVQTDIEGQPRNATQPDIGADEFSLAAVDAGLTELKAEAIICNGSGNVSVTVSNFGSVPINNFTLQWKIDTQSQPAVQASLAAGASAVITLGVGNFSAGNHTLAVLLQASGDLVSRNDTISKKIKAGGMSGTFTIGGINPDYPTINSAVAALQNGICGPVTFNIRSGIYTERVIIPYIAGTSEQNQIVFQSELLTNTSVVIFPETTTGSSILLDGSAWVTLRHLSLKGPNNHPGDVVEFKNKVFYTTLDNNLILGNASGWGIRASTEASLNFVTVSNNILKAADDGYSLQSGISFPATLGNENRIIGNEITLSAPNNETYKGLEIYNQNNIIIKENVVTANEGLDANWCFNDCEISSNYFKTKSIGLSAGNWFSQQSSKSKINNNIIESGNAPALSVGTGNIEIRNNTIISSGDLMGVRVSHFGGSFYLPPFSAIDFKNNIVVNKGEGVCLAITPNAPFNSDYNVFHSKGKQVFATMNGNVWDPYGFKTTRLFVGIFEWQKVTGDDVNSLLLIPRFVSETDFHINSDHRIAGKGIAGSVTTDIDGDVRDQLHPDIGADEFDLMLFANDAGISKVVRPDECGAEHALNVKVKNFGTNTLTSATINWSVNETVMPSFAWSGSLSAQQESGDIALQNFYFNPSDSFNIKVWTTLPNGLADPENINDTTEVKFIMQKLSGVYNIGVFEGADFSSFTAAADYLNRVGICGPATFYAYSGNYHEAFVLEDIPNTSATNRITFQAGEGPNTVFIYTDEWTTPQDDNFLIKGTDYITFKDLNFVTSSTTRSVPRVIKLVGSTHAEFIGNQFGRKEPAEGELGGFPTGLHVSMGSDIRIENNRFYNGWNAVTLESVDRAVIRANELEKMRYALSIVGISEGVEISSNSLRNIGFWGEAGIVIGAKGQFSVLNNKIYGEFYNALSIENSGTKLRESIVANNMISAQSESQGIFSRYNKNISYYHNSVLVDNPINEYVHTAFYTISDSIINVVNNTFVNLKPSINIWTGYALMAETHQSYQAYFDYNNYWSPDNLFQYKGTNYSSFADYKEGSGQDAHSVNINPIVVSATDLHIISPVLDGLGKSLPVISTDIDGEARDLNHPDIGADEFYVPAVDAGISAINPSVSVCKGTNNVIVVVRNFGKNLLTKATIAWTVNGVAQPSFTWTGSLVVGQMSTPVTIGTFNFNQLTNYTIKAWTVSPNDQVDEVLTNDSAEITTKPAAIGTFTIGGSNPDFITITAAVEMLKVYGVCGPVIFNIRNGVYQEHIVVPAIQGSSAVNHITFQSESGVAESAIITFATSDIKTGVLIFEQSDYITIRNLSIEVTGSERGYAVLMRGLETDAIEHIYLLNNIIKSHQAAWQEYGQGGVALYGEVSGLKVKNNHIQGGAQGLVFHFSNYYMPNVTNFVKDSVVNNRFINQLWRGIEGIGRHYVIKDNEITSNVAVNYRAAGIGLLHTVTDVTITGNKINFKGTGIMIEDCNCTITNNFITVKSGTVYPAAGMYVDGLDVRLKVFNNSILVSENNSQSAALYIRYIQNDSEFKNNIFANTGGGMVLDYGGAIPQTDYNAYYTTGTNFSRRVLSGSLYNPTLDSWKIVSGVDVNSFISNPQFVSVDDLHAQAQDLVGRGKPVTEVKVDIDGQLRHVTYPTVGADEFGTFVESDIVATGIGNAFYCEPVKTLKVTVKNMGVANVTSFKVRWKLDGLQQADKNWTGNLGFGTQTEFSIAQLPALSSGAHSIEVTIDKTSGAADQFPANNTTQLSCTLYPAVSLGNDILRCADLTQAVTLDAGANYQSYAWASGETTQTLSVSQAKEYSVSVTDLNGCVSKDTVELSYLSPEVMISREGNALLASAGSSFQWLLNGEPISNATQGSYTPIENGQYQVRVIQQGCEITSDAIDFVITATEDEWFLRGINYFPNPVKDIVTITHPQTISGESITVLDNLGRQIRIPFKQVNQKHIEFSTSEITDGTYYLKVKSNSLERVIKLTVIH